MCVFIKEYLKNNYKVLRIIKVRKECVFLKIYL